MVAVTGRPLAAVLAAVLLVLTACSNGGDQVRGYLRDTYGAGMRSGDTESWRTPDPIGPVVSGIVGRAQPAARQADGASEYLRYDDDIVVVTPAVGGGSDIRAEDLDGRYAGGFYAFLGGGFRPGSPAGGAGGGGPGDVK